jgi:biopolymer transport protein ExbD
MKHALEVCLVALALADFTTPSVGAQTLAAASRNSLLTEGRPGVAQTMQEGTSVELPVTSNAKPVPNADHADALIVTVTDEGGVYLGLNPVSSAELGERVKQALSNRADKTIYIKGDARTTYGSVVKVLDSMRSSGVEGLTLLTSQRDTEEVGAVVPPNGLEMVIVPDGAESPLVGTWQGKIHDLPAVTLNLHDTGGKLSGDIVFYMIRNDGAGYYEDSKAAGSPTELTNVKFDGTALTFEVSHRNAHPPRTLNDAEPVKFRLTLTGDGVGNLDRLNYGADDEPLILRKEK